MEIILSTKYLQVQYIASKLWKNKSSLTDLCQFAGKNVNLPLPRYAKSWKKWLYIFCIILSLGSFFIEKQSIFTCHLYNNLHWFMEWVAEGLWQGKNKLKEINSKPVNLILPWNKDLCFHLTKYTFFLVFSWNRGSSSNICFALQVFSAKKLEKDP